MWMVAQEENQNSFRRLLGMSLHLRCFVTLSELYLNLKIHALVVVIGYLVLWNRYRLGQLSVQNRAILGYHNETK